MKIERTKNAARNIVSGVLLQLVRLAAPFLMRTAILYTLGVQYLGLNGLFTSVLQVLNLAELGVGAAMVYSMYQPIVEDDHNRICALMNLYRSYYRIIGAVVLGLGLAILPILPYLIQGDVPADLNLHILYLVNLAATVGSYWCFAYHNSVFLAHQRNDVINKVSLMTDFLKYSTQATAILVFKNYYGFVMAVLFSQIINNLLIAAAARCQYPQYRAQGKIDRQDVRRINHRIRDMLTAKLGSVITGASDTIVISAFLGLEILAVYQNYYFLLSAVAGMMIIISKSILAGIGNSIIVDSQQKVFADFRVFLFAIAWGSGLCSCCFLCLYQPFLTWWVGDSLLLEMPMVVCFVVFFYVSEINRLLIAYKDASGMWHKDRMRPLAAAGSNLALNLILVQLIGLYGVILSTILSIAVVGMPWLIQNLFAEVFDLRDKNVFLRRLLQYTLVTSVACMICYLLCLPVPLNGMLGVLVRLGICLVSGNTVMFLCYGRISEFGQSVKLLDRITHGKISVLHRFAGKFQMNEYYARKN